MSEYLDPQAKKYNWPRRKDGSKIIEADPGGESLTDQSFKEECDTNRIMEIYMKTGQLPGGGKPQENSGDFSEYPGYAESLNIITKAREKFDELPSNVRKRFSNDPAELLRFIEDENNVDEAISLGLLNESFKPKGATAPAAAPSNPQTTAPAKAE